jgi:hypothetical protein
MKNILIITLIFSLLSCRKNELTVINNSTWIEDIEYIQQVLPDYHVNLFSNISQEEFNSQIESFIEEIPELKEHEIMCETMKIFAQIGDSHTGIHNENNLSNFTLAPINFKIFGDGVFITEFPVSYDQYLKQEVVSINGHSIEAIFDSVATVLPHENDYFV